MHHCPLVGGQAKQTAFEGVGSRNHPNSAGRRGVLDNSSRALRHAATNSVPVVHEVATGRGNATAERFASLRASLLLGPINAVTPPEQIPPLGSGTFLGATAPRSQSQHPDDVVLTARHSAQVIAQLQEASSMLRGLRPRDSDMRSIREAAELLLTIDALRAETASGVSTQQVVKRMRRSFAHMRVLFEAVAADKKEDRTRDRKRLCPAAARALAPALGHLPLASISAHKVSEGDCDDHEKENRGAVAAHGEQRTSRKAAMAARFAALKSTSSFSASVDGDDYRATNLATAARTPGTAARTN
jgi:hypothetical protein